MENLFLTAKKPLLTVMLICRTPEEVIARIRGAICEGAEAFCLQVEYLEPEYHNRETYERIFKELRGRPCYVTYYRGRSNKGKTDEELAQGLLLLAECGASLCDVMGDLYCRAPDQLTTDEAAVEKQKRLIADLHKAGAAVLMSCHVLKFTPEERVVEIARAQESRGADIIKIVVFADTLSEQLENLRLTHVLAKMLPWRTLFLSGGKCSLHRRLGMHLGSCMVLCTYRHDELSSMAQPLLSVARKIREDLGFQYEVDL